MIATEEDTTLLVSEARKKFEEIKKEILSYIPDAAQLWKVINTHGDAEDLLWLNEQRSGIFELVALVAEDKLLPEMVDVLPSQSAMEYMARVLCLEDQRKLLEEGKLVLHFRNPSGQPDRRVVPLEAVTKNQLQPAVNLETKRLKTKAECLSTVLEKPTTTVKKPVPIVGPQGPIKIGFRGGKNSKRVFARVGAQEVTHDYLVSILQELTEYRARSGRPTKKVELKLTQEELELAEKTVEKSNGVYRDVADYCRKRLLAYGAI